MTLSEQLSEIIETYFERFPNMSINGLAQKSGVGATTIRRIKNKTAKSSLAPHVVLGIVSAVTKEKQLSKIINLIDGPIGAYLTKSFSSYVEMELPHKYDEDLNSLFEDQITYFIYKLAANRKGTSKLEICELYGKIGLDRLSKLIKRKAVKVSADRIHALNKNFSADIEVVAKHLPELVKFYKPQNLKEGQNMFYTLSETINEKGIKKIKDIEREAIKKVYDIMQSPLYEGDIPYFTLKICDTLQINSNFGVKQ